MLRSVFIIGLVASLACGASVEKRETEKAEARDTHGGGGGGGGSSYSSAVDPPPSTYDGGSQGNLYYYYYPVEQYGDTEVADAGFDIFTAIILPLLILGGILLALSSLTFTFTAARNLREGGAEPTLIVTLHDEIERAFYRYLSALESEQCIQRTICEAGVRAKSIKGKEFIFSLVEPFIPEGMKGNVAIFKKAALSGYDTGKCKKYRCIAPKIS